MIDNHWLVKIGRGITQNNGLSKKRIKRELHTLRTKGPVTKKSCIIKNEKRKDVVKRYMPTNRSRRRWDAKGSLDRVQGSLNSTSSRCHAI